MLNIFIATHVPGRSRDGHIEDDTSVTFFFLEKTRGARNADKINPEKLRTSIDHWASSARQIKLLYFLS